MSIYKKYMDGDLAQSLEAQYRLNPVRLSIDKASFPVATKDMANIVGLEVGVPFRPTLPSEGLVLDQMVDEIQSAGLMRNAMV